MTISRNIEFVNNNAKVYYSGQQLNGVVRIGLDVETQIKTIYLIFVGSGSCKWTIRKRLKSTTVHGTRFYLKERKYVLRNRNNAFTILPAGISEFPFSVQLPNNLATSYEGTYGQVRYIVSLNIETSSTERNHVPEALMENFTIIRPLNLNTVRAFQMPMYTRLTARFNKCFFICCWKTPNLTLFARLPVSGYCAGQIMNLTLRLVNSTGVVVYKILVQFVLVVTYRSNEGLQKKENLQLDEKRIEVFRNGTATCDITVPSVPPTTFSDYHIVGFNYFLRIVVVTGLTHRNPVFNIPIIIGTFPILDEVLSAAARRENTADPVVPATEEAFIRRSPSIISLNSTYLPPYSDEDPPTYEEAIRGTLPRNENFVPSYPTYRRATSYSCETLNL